MSDTKCACHCLDARACFLSRHPEAARRCDVDTREYDAAMDEVCECHCHTDDGYDDDYDLDDSYCDRCGGEGSIEYDDAPEVWGGDCPDEVNHLVTCPECHGSGVL